MDDQFPEEYYFGISNPDIYYRLDKKWDVMLYNKKLGDYKIAWILNGRKFFDQEFTLPVSEGWEFYESYGSEPARLNHYHSQKANEMKMTQKEYKAKYLPDNDLEEAVTALEDLMREIHDIETTNGFLLGFKCREKVTRVIKNFRGK